MATWILVCNASRAQVISANGKNSKNGHDDAWTLVRELDHPESRARNLDIVSDKPGRMQESMNNGSRSAMEAPTTPKEAEGERFAQELVKLLDHEFDRHAFEELVLVAAPHFLGRLRKLLPSKVAKRIVASIAKDYSGQTLRELQPRLQRQLQHEPA